MHTLHLTTGRRSFFDAQIDALRAQGVQCTVLEVPGTYTAADSRSVIDYLRYYPELLAAQPGAYDLVHANHGLTVPFALAQPTRPVVTTFWGSDLMSDRAWQTALGRYCARHADRVILPSEIMGRSLDTPYTHVPFPVDTETFEPMAREAAKAALGWDTESADILFPYDPDRPEKDYARAQRVVETAAAEADLRTVTGQPHDAMATYLNASDAVLVTSKRESGPMIVREAAACNVPVVSTDVGFVRETLAGVEVAAVCTSDTELVAGLEAVLSAQRRPESRSTIDQLHPEWFGHRLEHLYTAVCDRAEVPA